MSPRPLGGVARSLAAVMIMAGCGGSSPTPDRPSPAPPPTGGNTVSGSERLAWNQTGDVSDLTFRAYVDGNPVELSASTCGQPAEEIECSSPFPPMTDGEHTIVLTAVSRSSGAEGERSETMTVQKVSARSVVGAAAVSDGRVVASGLSSATVVTTSSDVAFAADVVARGLAGPVQLASTPDGRLLVADNNARVSVVRPGEVEPRDAALDARALLHPPPIGGLGLAVHPEFARTRFVFVSFLARDGSDRTSLRIVRFREVGDTLGEPLSLYEAPVVVTPRAWRIGEDGQEVDAQSELPAGGPRLAFGPDGLLYSLLPPGVAFHNDPAASRPVASMLRISDEGRVPDAAPMTGITAHPFGLAWHPTTAALWLIFPGSDDAAVVQSANLSPVSGEASFGRGVLRMVTDAASSASTTLVLQPSGMLELARAFPQGIHPASIGTVRLTMPIVADGVVAGLNDRITDLVPAGGGVLYLATSDPARPDSGDVVVRLRPR